jgi:omega-hydroxy-beta-dihydromenaquinone-9 sulfotransferase
VAGENGSAEAAIAPLAWYQAALWMGTNLGGLCRLLHRHGGRMPWRAWPEATVDLAFSCANSVLGAAQQATFSRRVAGILLPDDPIFILGHWRTGTTLLHELLSLDPRHRCPTTFECFLPNHFLLSERWLKPWTGFVLPAARPSDNMPVSWDLPQEDEFALALLGIPSPYWMIAFPNEPPRCDDYFELDRLPEDERRRWKAALVTFLKQLTWKKPGRLVLKSPPHTFRLPVLNEMFPSARYMHVVRNPMEVFPSTCRLWKSLFAVHAYQKPTYRGLEEFVLATFARMHERLEVTRGLIPADRFCELRYEELVLDPLAEMERIYEQLQLGDFDSVAPLVREYVTSRQGYHRNTYSLPDNTRGEIAVRWRAYFERYGYVSSISPTKAIARR